jgi:hypothetical protein
VVDLREWGMLSPLMLHNSQEIILYVNTFTISHFHFASSCICFGACHCVHGGGAASLLVLSLL